LAGIDFGLYVDKQTYESWLNLLKGLVMAKERDSRYWRRSRHAPRAVSVSKPVVPLSIPPVRPAKHWSTRARSTSPDRFSHLPFSRHDPPTSFTFRAPHAYRSPVVPMDTDSPVRSSSKRSALDAFSPTSAAFELERPSKKPTGLALEIPDALGSGVHTPSPLESLQSFSKLSLGSSPASHSSAESATTHGLSSSTVRHIPPQTLLAAYRLDPTKPRTAPQV